MKSTHSHRAAALIVALLTLVSAIGISAALLSTASLTLNATRADAASVRAERIALDLEPRLVQWATEHRYTAFDDELMPTGWFEIHVFEHEDLTVRVQAIDLAGCISLHPNSRGRVDLLPETIRAALLKDAGGPDATLESLVDLERLRGDATWYPPVDSGTRTGLVLSEWITHINTGGWNTRTARDELRSLAGLAPPDPRQGPRDSRAGDTRLLAESNAFAVLIDIQQPALLMRTWCVIAREANERGRRSAWDIVERRRLP